MLDKKARGNFPKRWAAVTMRRFTAFNESKPAQK
jgi:hypothetical protein